MHRRLIGVLVPGLALTGGLLLPFAFPSQAGAEIGDVPQVTGTADAAPERLPDGRQLLGTEKWALVETLVVRADAISGTTSTTVLDASRRYAFRASGLWVNQRPGFVVDAEYSVCDGIVRDGHPPDPEALDANWGDLRINGKFVDWGAYNVDHVYRLTMSGSGATVRFDIHDGHPNGDEPPLWRSDNSGSLIVEIYEASEPVPECVCPIVRRRVPSAVIADALAQPERYFGWMVLLDPNKPPSPANPPRTCLSLHRVGLHYDPVWNRPEWRAGCP